MKILLSLILVATLLTGCTAEVKPSSLTSYEAYDLIKENPAIIILDVRSEEEFLSGHIKGAILLPVDEIDERAETVLTDKNATILVICRTGIRSQAASYTLVSLGYKSVYDIGGIVNWPGELVK